MSGLDPVALPGRIEALGRAAAEVLADASAPSLGLRLSRLSARWLDRADPFRTEAERRLPEVAGFSEPMVRRALDETFGALVWPALGRLAGVTEGARTTLVVAAGAIPDPLVRSIYRALLGKSAVLVKPSSAEPILAGLLARSLEAIDPPMGRCLDVATWRGGDREVEDVVLAGVDRVVAYGSDEAIADLAARVPPATPFEGRGHRWSVAVVGRGALSGTESLEDLGRRIARDVALYDQSGCLSPQAVYVEEGTTGSAADLADRIANHLARFATSLPPGRLDPARALAIHEERARLEMAGTTVLSGPDLAWTVSIEPGAGFRPSPGHRFLRVRPVEDLGPVAAVLAALPLQAIAVSPSHPGPIQAPPGVRVCPIGTLQTPPVEWLER